MPHMEKKAEETLTGKARQADNGPQEWKSGLQHGFGGDDKAAGKQMHVKRTAEYGIEQKPDQTIMGPEMASAGDTGDRGGNVDYGDSSTTSDMGPRIEKV